MKFNVGDRVVAIGSCEELGAGTVTYVNDGGIPYRVLFDRLYRNEKWESWMGSDDLRLESNARPAKPLTLPDQQELVEALQTIVDGNCGWQCQRIAQAALAKFGG
jgi:hypothetical protein